MLQVWTGLPHYGIDSSVIRTRDHHKEMECFEPHRLEELTHVNSAWEGLALGQNGVAISQVRHVVLSRHVVSLVHSQVGKRLSWIAGVNLIGSRGLVNHVESTSQQAWISAIGELSLLKTQLELLLFVASLFLD